MIKSSLATKQGEPILEDQETVIYADNHTLFIEEVPPAMVAVESENNDKVYKQSGGYTVYKLFIGDFDEQGNGIQRIMNKLQQAQGEDVLELHISSQGGVIAELLEMYNMCDSVFYNRITTFCNYGYSAGALAFLFGQERAVYEYSDWMMHSYSGGFGGKRDDLISHLKHEDKRLTKFVDVILGDYFSKKELKQMHKGKDFWMTSTEMLERGIATHIIKNGTIIPAEEYLNTDEVKKVKKVKKDKKVKKYLLG